MYRHHLRPLLVTLGLVSVLASGTELRAQRTLSLDSCRRLALSHSRLLEQREAEAAGATAKRQEVLTKFFPQVSARGLYLHMQKELHLIDWSTPLAGYNFIIPDRIRQLGTIDLRNVWVANVTAIQPLYLGGKLVSGYRMAGLNERLQTELRRTTETEVETKLDEVYWQVVSLRSKERLLSQVISLLERTTKDVDAAIETGVATKADGLAIRTKLSEAEVNGLALSRMLLADLCGLEEDETFTLADEGEIQTELQLEAARAYQSEDIAAAVERRSEVRSLRLVDSIYGLKVRMETADLLPQLYGFASYSATNPNSFNGTKKEFGSQYYLGVMLQVPISDLFSATFRRRQARSEQTAKQLQLAEARSKISLQIKQALRAVEDARRAWSASLKAVELARENMRYAEVGYREGVIPLINYTQAQTAWMSAQDGLIDSQIQLLLSKSKLKNILAL